jgi:HD-like signal output (HDOD) protein
MSTDTTTIDKQSADDILKNISIPPCPSVVIALLKEAEQPDVDFNKLTKLISGDVSLAVAMLKMANSPFFALRNKVSSVQMALSVLGLKNIVQLVRGQALRQSMGNIPMERFWDRSQFSAVVSSKIASGIHGISREDAYTYGLFHDCGIPILMQKFPDYKQKLAEANRSADLIITIEDQHYSTNHALVGSMLARTWFLPKHLCQAILKHHDHSIFDDGNEDGDVCSLVAIAMISEHIVASFLQLPDDAEWLTGGQAAMGYLGLILEELEDITEDCMVELGEMKSYRG